MTPAEPAIMDNFRAVAGAADRLAARAAPIRLRLAALALAMTAHAALLYALAKPAADTLAGGGGQQLDAISVTIVSSAALESLQADLAHPPAPAAAGTVEANEGAAESPPAPQQQEQREAVQDQKSLPEPEETATPDPTPRQMQKPDSKRAPAGGVASRGDAPDTASRRAPAAASAGALREYARYVAQALAKAKPKGVGTPGTVKVKLVIAPAGGLASVAVAKTSGNKRLDAMAIAAVQQAALPAPPTGLTPAQLTYEIPYHFR